MSLQPVDVQRIFLPGVRMPGESRRGFSGYLSSRLSTLMSRIRPVLRGKRGSYIVLRSGAVAARQSHNLEADGASPSSVTTFDGRSSKSGQCVKVPESIEAHRPDIFCAVFLFVAAAEWALIVHRLGTGRWF